MQCASVRASTSESSPARQVGCRPADEEDLRSQVVAEARHEALVEKQRMELPARETRIRDPLEDGVLFEAFREHVRTELGQEGVSRRPAPP